MQYQQHYNNVKGKFVDTIEHFKAHMDEENGHAHSLCMRICSLGGTPTTEIDPLAPFTSDIDEALKQDILAEKKTIKLYTEILDLCEQANDRATEMLIGKILGDEVEHLDEFCKFRKVLLK
jgi:bacterioferritin (cytochrome b1)